MAPHHTEAVHEAVRLRHIANKVFLTITTVLHRLQLAVTNLLGTSEMSSQTPAPARSFFPSSNIIISGGTFNQHHYSQTQSGTKSTCFPSLLVLIWCNEIWTYSAGGFDRPLEFVAPNALHDSGHVVDPPKCYPGTRVAIIQTIVEWIAGTEEANRDKFFTWLAGAAGSGKSVIGKSLCERGKEEGTLLASFFFGSSDSTRNHSRLVAATITYQIESYARQWKVYWWTSVDISGHWWPMIGTIKRWTPVHSGIVCWKLDGFQCIPVWASLMFVEFHWDPVNPLNYNV